MSSLPKRPVSADVEQIAASFTARVPASPSRSAIPARASKYRHASRRCQITTTEDNPTRASASAFAPPARRRMMTRRNVLGALAVGVGFGGTLELIRIGQWVQLVWTDTQTQWHDGDAGVTQLTADVGHGGTSRFIACYYHGAILVIEWTHNGDPSHEHTYTIQIGTIGDTTKRTVALSVDAQKNLIVQINGTPFGYVLRNTGDQFQATAQQEGASQ